MLACLFIGMYVRSTLHSKMQRLVFESRTLSSWIWPCGSSSLLYVDCLSVPTTLPYPHRYPCRANVKWLYKPSCLGLWTSPIHNYAYCISDCTIVLVIAYCVSDTHTLIVPTTNVSKQKLVFDNNNYVTYRARTFYTVFLYPLIFSDDLLF